MTEPSGPQPRRDFLARLGALGASLGVLSPRTVAAMEPARSGTEDPWVARLRGAHRVIFHSHMPTEGLALRWAQTFLDTQKSAYGIAEADMSVLVGLNGRSVGWFFNDAMWAKYPTIGEVMGAPGTRNPQSTAIAALASRGVFLLACANSIRASGQRFLPDPGRNDTSARTAFADDVRANLIAGVEVVPAMIVTLQQAQDRGCRYIYAGG